MLADSPRDGQGPSAQVVSLPRPTGEGCLSAHDVRAKSCGVVYDAYLVSRVARDQLTARRTAGTSFLSLTPLSSLLLTLLSSLLLTLLSSVVLSMTYSPVVVSDSGLV